jgi:hypothetical protein
MTKTIILLSTLLGTCSYCTTNITFTELKNKTDKEIKDFTITDQVTLKEKADIDFFNGKTLANVTFDKDVSGELKNVSLKNVTFNGNVSGSWTDVTTSDVIKFKTCPTNLTANQTTINKRTANLITPTGKTINLTPSGKFSCPN